MHACIQDRDHEPGAGPSEARKPEHEIVFRQILKYSDYACTTGLRFPQLLHCSTPPRVNEQALLKAASYLMCSMRHGKFEWPHRLLGCFARVPLGVSRSGPSSSNLVFRYILFNLLIPMTRPDGPETLSAKSSRLRFSQHRQKGLLPDRPSVSMPLPTRKCSDIAVNP